MLIGVVGHLMHHFPGNWTSSQADNGKSGPQCLMLEHLANSHLHLLEFSFTVE